uniref:Uncharacterized protein n=1 Tax=Rhizophora mucronata TaxID=61149 RepID=A0A2P2MTP2_RHIMU
MSSFFFSSSIVVVDLLTFDFDMLMVHLECVNRLNILILMVVFGQFVVV